MVKTIRQHQTLVVALAELLSDFSPGAAQLAASTKTERYKNGLFILVVYGLKVILVV
jgi:hypothetical protein